jgi:ABC-2 type transport system ATP-binding protein
VIRQGRLIAIGVPDDLRARASRQEAEIVGHGFTEQALAQLRARPEVTRAEVRNGCLYMALRAESDKISPLVSLLVQAGAVVEEVRRGSASLEDVFLTLMRREEQP